jgi:hypothetical protein
MCGIDVHMDPNIGKRLKADLNSVSVSDLSDEDDDDIMSSAIHALSRLTAGNFWDWTLHWDRNIINSTLFCTLVAICGEREVNGGSLSLHFIKLSFN